MLKTSLSPIAAPLPALATSAMHSKLKVPKLIAAGLMMLCAYDSHAQQAVLPKLEIKPGKTYHVPEGNILRVDTLIMHDKAVIQFNPGQYGILRAETAYIGNKCLITSKGADGKKGKPLEQGEDGSNGGSLNLILHFERLGQLTIDTRGGSGGDGADGKHGNMGTPDRTVTKTRAGADGKPVVELVIIPGQQGTDGTDATQGGNGGHGGDLSLAYSTAGFIPIFNKTSRNEHSIIILNTAGSQGNPGRPGKGGINSSDGDLRPAYFRESRAGQLELINLNSSSNF